MTDRLPDTDQSQIGNLITLVQSLMKMVGQSGPAIMTNGLYSRGEIEDRLHISNTTMTAWIDFNDLEPWQPGTKEQFFFGQDVIDWMRAHKKGIINPKTAKAKTAARKAKEK